MLTHKNERQNGVSEPYTVNLYAGKLAIESDNAGKIEQLLSFASRYNDKRQYMFASNVLGKYIPACPLSINSAQSDLISKVNLRDVTTTVMGFAESACGLGEAIFCKLMVKHPNLINKSIYTHTTRQYFNNEQTLIEFVEPHSHAADQVLLMPKSDLNRHLLTHSECLVVIEDEITTGKTLSNFIEKYYSVNSHLRRLIILTYVDWRTTKQAVSLRKQFPMLEIEEHALLTGNINFSVERQNVRFEPKRRLPTDGPDDLHGSTFTSNSKYAISYFERPVENAVQQIWKATNQFNDKALIVGTSEFTFWPQKVALHCKEKGLDVLNISSTRAPLQVRDDIHSKLEIVSHYGDGEQHFIYNIQSDRKIFFAYENYSQAEEHRELLESLNAQAIILEREL